MTDYADLVAQARAGTLAVVDDGGNATPEARTLVVIPPVEPPAPVGAPKKPTRLVLPDHPEDYAWERLKGEPQFWYERFERYLRMPYERGRRVRPRKLAQVYKEHRHATSPDFPIPDKPPANWYDNSHKYRWIERAEMYDAWYDAQQRQALMNRVSQDREDRETHLKAIRGKLARRVTMMTDEEIAKLPPAIVFNALAQLNRELRAESEQALEVDARALGDSAEDDALPFKAYGEGEGAWVDEI